MEEELVEKVKLYLQRVQRDKTIPNYPFGLDGFYRIIGGSRGDYGYREPMKDIFHGRFIDAVAFAVQQNEFYTDWCSPQDPSNCNHGYVEKISVHYSKDEDLVKAIFGGY